MRARPLVRSAVLLAGVSFATAGCERAGRSARLVFEPHPDVLHAVETDEPLVALTLDDGPDAGATPRILALLAEHDAHATFFLIARRIRGHEALVKAIVDGGHELGNHGARDIPSLDLDREVFERELEEAHDTLTAFQVPRWFRPASGFYDEPMLDIIARHGYRAALGSIYPLDAQHAFPWLTRLWVSVDVEPGDVVVLHDGPQRGLRTVEVLRELLPELRDRGLRVVSLTELVDQGR